MQSPILPDASRPPMPPLPPGAGAPLPPTAPTMPPFTPQAPMTPAPVAAPAFAPSPVQPGAYGQQVGQPMVGTPDTAGSDLSKLIPANGQGGGVTVILGIMAVAGGGAAWKFYSQRSKEKHEQSMKEIELRSTANDQQRQKCDASAASSATAIKDLGARCDDIARKVSEQGAAVEALSKRVAISEELVVKTGKLISRTDDLEERLETVERKTRRAAKDEA